LRIAFSLSLFRPHAGKLTRINTPFAAQAVADDVRRVGVSRR
jgi:hypothetical protein